MAESPGRGAIAALPKQFGPYRVVRPLGRGGMGVVFLAEDTRLSRLVALKVCNVSIADKPTLERFRREATSAAALRHPGLCPVYEFDVRDDIPYLAMAYIDGPTLADWMTSRVPLEPRTAAVLVSKMAAAIQAAHARGVVHRDLKPGNVLLEKNSPVIVDFGLARQTGGGANLTKKGAVVGTPSYMSPEQVRGDNDIGPGCDVYALGVILYEMLTGRRPFEGPTGVVLAQILYTPVAPPSKHRPDLDRQLEAVCLKAMAKAPQARYASMTELAKALEPFARATAVGASAPRRRPSKLASADTEANQPPTQPTTTPRPDASAKPLAILHILLLLLCVAALAAVVSFPWWKDHLLGSGRKPANDVVVEPDPPEKPPELLPAFTNSVEMKLVLIRPGSFLMGAPTSDTDRSPDEFPHPVGIARPFYLGTCEVTQGQFERVLGKDRNLSFFKKGKKERAGVPDHPVERVTWEEAVEFCTRLSEMPEEKTHQRVYRLPTEAEWEYGCRADTTGPYNFGGAAGLGAHAWFQDNALGKTHPVGGKPANGWGLYDMHGNVAEWCADWYDPRYGEHGAEVYRVARGGSWSQNARDCRSANRLNRKPGTRYDNIGFRVAATVGAGK